MPEDLWSAVDSYFGDTLSPMDDALLAALADSDRAGLPQIAVSPNQGKLLELLVRVMGARKVLEIGTLGGFSTILMARGLAAGGKLISLEYEAKHAEVARKNIARAGLADRAEVRVGAALDLLPALVSEAPFDFVFIDADKENNGPYVEWALKLGRSGTVIFVDNVARAGRVLEPGSSTQVDGVRRMVDFIAREPRLEATAMQTVGLKGHDGFALLRVK